LNIFIYRREYIVTKTKHKIFKEKPLLTIMKAKLEHESREAIWKINLVGFIIAKTLY